jgi:hypothetical protein
MTGLGKAIERFLDVCSAIWTLSQVSQLVQNRLCAFSLISPFESCLGLSSAEVHTQVDWPSFAETNAKIKPMDLRIQEPYTRVDLLNSIIRNPVRRLVYCRTPQEMVMKGTISLPEKPGVRRINRKSREWQTAFV